jgi:hypothetical protein
VLTSAATARLLPDPLRRRGTPAVYVRQDEVGRGLPLLELSTAATTWAMAGPR